LNDDEEHYKWLCSLSHDYSNLIKVEHRDWNPSKTWLSYMLGDCWDRTIQFAIDNNYKYWVWTASDIFSSCKNGVNNQIKLIESQKNMHIVGYPTNIYTMDGPPSVLHSADMLYDDFKGMFVPDFYCWTEILKARNASPNGIVSLWGSIGFTTFDRDAFTHSRFLHPTNYQILSGCDLIYLQQIHKAGFEYWCDMNHRALNMKEPLSKAEDVVGSYKDMFLKVHEVKG